MVQLVRPADPYYQDFFDRQPVPPSHRVHLSQDTASLLASLLSLLLSQDSLLEEQRQQLACSGLPASSLFQALGSYTLNETALINRSNIIRFYKMNTKTDLSEESLKYMLWFFSLRRQNTVTLGECIKETLPHCPGR